jgi:hypothetical protein
MQFRDQHYRAIGRIVVEFQNMEQWLTFCVWELVGPDQYVGQMVTARLSIKYKRDLLASLFKHHCQDQKVRDELRALLGEVAEAEDRRNELLHSLWGFTGIDQPVVHRRKINTTIKKGLAHDMEAMTPEALDAIADGFKSLTVKIANFLTDRIPSPRPAEAK